MGERARRARGVTQAVQKNAGTGIPSPPAYADATARSPLRWRGTKSQWGRIKPRGVEFIIHPDFLQRGHPWIQILQMCLRYPLYFEIPNIKQELIRFGVPDLSFH